MAKIMLAPSIAFMATVSLIIEFMVVTLQSCGRAMFRMVIWLGFDALHIDLVIFKMEASCHKSFLRPFGSV